MNYGYFPNRARTNNFTKCLGNHNENEGGLQKRNQPAQQVVFSLDLELFGPLHPIKAIGAAVTLQPEQTVLAKFKVSILTKDWHGKTCDQFWKENPHMADLVRRKATPDQEKTFFSNCGFEYHCLKNFWLRFPNLLGSLDIGAVPFQMAVKQLCWFYDKQAKQFGDRLVVIGDNPALDIGIINNIFLNKNRLPLSYRAPGIFTEILDVKMLIRGLLGVHDPQDRRYIGKFLQKFNLRLPTPDHDPLNDAIRIANLYGYYLQVCSKAYQ